MYRKVKDFYSSSFADLQIERRMVRTKGSEQVPVWYNDEMPEGNWEIDREYHAGIYQGKPYFAKRVLCLPDDYPMSIPEFIEYQAESHWKLRHLTFVPDLYGYSDDTLIMSLHLGLTLKQLILSGMMTLNLFEILIPLIESRYNRIKQMLNRQKYDLSVNNIILTDDYPYQPIFIDFDPAEHEHDFLAFKAHIKQVLSLLKNHDIPNKNC